MVDYGKLLDGLNEGLQAYAQEALVFPVAEELPPLVPSPPSPFALGAIQPPGSLYLDVGAQINLFVTSTLASQTVRFTFLTVNLRNEIKAHTFEVTSGAVGVTNAILVDIGGGFLLSAHARTTTSVPRLGQCYAKAVLIARQGVPVVRSRVIISGYVTLNYELSFPETEPLLATDIAPYPRVVTVANPAAGLEWTTTVPAGTLWEVVGVSYIFTTDATVANRRMAVVATYATGGTVVLGVAGTTQTASLVRNYSGANTLQHQTTVTTFIVFPLATTFPLLPSTVITTSTDNLQAGDVYDTIFLFVRERVDF